MLQIIVIQVNLYNMLTFVESTEKSKANKIWLRNQVA